MGGTPQADPGQPIRLALGDVTAPAQMALASADAQPVPVETVRPEDIAPAMETQVTMAALEPAAPLIKADIPAASIPAPRLASVTQPARAKNVRSEEHTSELQSLMRISNAVFCLKKTN